MHSSSRGAALAAVAVIGFFLLLLGGCNNDSPTAVQELQTAEERVDGEIALGGGTVVAARNQVGPIFVNGEGLGPKIRWFMNRSASAPTLAEARNLLRNITLTSATEADTLALRVSAPENSTTASYTSLLSLGVPLDAPCRIDQVLGEIFVSSLFADLQIANAGRVTVLQHAGNCRISSSRGDIAVQIALPVQGVCTVSTSSGNVSIVLAANTSARVSCATGDGLISVVGLVLSDVNRTAASLTGTLGSGMGEVQLSTGKGNIEIKAP